MIQVLRILNEKFETSHMRPVFSINLSVLRVGCLSVCVFETDHIPRKQFELRKQRKDHILSFQSFV